MLTSDSLGGLYLTSTDADRPIDASELDQIEEIKNCTALDSILKGVGQDEASETKQVAQLNFQYSYTFDEVDVRNVVAKLDEFKENDSD